MVKDWKMAKGWRVQWRKGHTVRYYSSRFGEIQVGRYRGQDKFDRDMKQKYKWHGKWYVDMFRTGKIKLFNTQKQAMTHVKKYLTSKTKRKKR